MQVLSKDQWNPQGRVWPKTFSLTETEYTKTFLFKNLNEHLFHISVFFTEFCKLFFIFYKHKCFFSLLSQFNYFYPTFCNLSSRSIWCRISYRPSWLNDNTILLSVYVSLPFSGVSGSSAREKALTSYRPSAWRWYGQWVVWRLCHKSQCWSWSRQYN